MFLYKVNTNFFLKNIRIKGNYQAGGAQQKHSYRVA